MIGISPSLQAYIPAAQPQLAGLYRDVSRQTNIPQPVAALPATGLRAVTDQYDAVQAGAINGAGVNGVGAHSRTDSGNDKIGGSDKASGDSTDKTAGPLAGGFDNGDRGTTDDSSGAGKQHAQDRQQEAAVRAELSRLSAIDSSVRAHELAHAAVGGQYAGAPSYQLHRGPDGRDYAVGGEVSIDVSAVPGDPAATIRKLETVERAALAPADPSPQDRRVASLAQSGIAQARAEQLIQKRKEAADTETFRRDGKTDTVDASRIRFVTEPQSYIPNPFGKRPSIPAGTASKYLGGDNLIGIRLNSPVDISARLERYGVSDSAAQEFRATA